MGNKKSHLVIYILFGILCFSSCKKKEYTDYTDLFLDDRLLFSTAQGPYLALSVKKENDIRYIVCPSYWLKDDMLLYGGFTHKNYKDSLIRAIRNNFPLEINDSLFHILQKENRFVYRNHTIDSLFWLYNDSLTVLFNEVLCYKEFSYPLVIKKPADAEWYSEGAYNYLIYLLFQRGFYVVRDEEEWFYLIYDNSKGFKKRKN